MPTAERNKRFNGMTKAEYERRKNIFENSGPFYKVLQRGSDGKLYSCSGGDKCWGDGKTMPAQWETEKEVLICKRGLHITSDPMIWLAEESTHETFEVEIPWQDKSVQITDLRDNEKIAVSKMRLLRPIDPRVLAQFGLVRGDVALHYLTRKPNVSAFKVQSGKSEWHNNETMRIDTYDKATLETSGIATFVRAYDESNVDASQCKVEFNSIGSLTAGNGSYCTVQTKASVYARGGSVVVVNGGTPRIYAENGAVVVLKAPAHVVKAPGDAAPIITALNPNLLLKNSRLFAVVDKFGRFLKFVELDSSIPTDAKIVL